MNGIRPMLVSAQYGQVPTIDGDFMGRAYPRVYIMTPYRELVRTFWATNFANIWGKFSI
jgi:DUF917 family protein